MRCRLVGSQRDLLGEGPVWDAPTGRLYWVDSYAGRVRRLEPDGRVRTWPMPAMIGSLAVAGDEALVVALQNGLYAFDCRSGALAAIANPEADEPRTRFNDGATDRQGRFVTGTMGIRERTVALGSLYRVDPDRHVARLRGDIVVFNGPCFAPDGGRIWFTDGRRRILTAAWDPATGAMADARVHIDFTGTDLASDGATIDADGHLWTALITRGEIAEFDRRGRLLRAIRVPVRLPSSVCWGGAQLDRLFVTSIRDSGNRTADGADDGALLVIDGLGARGIADTRFGG